ncbi:MAG: hypothetical protein LBV70_06670, partial [Candidatus Adiutrix sp.]|nr:hypothetical protein [Candidatus Adiutrix sp.]
MTPADARPGPAAPGIWRRAALAAAAALWLLAGLMCGQVRAEGELARANKNREAFLADTERLKTRGHWLELIKEYEKAALA